MRYGILALTAAMLAGCGGEKLGQYNGDWTKMKPFTPKGYVCYRTAQPIQIDGRAGEAAWKSAPWTDYFGDIEGSPKPRVTPRFKTRAKILWDDSYLYVYAELEEPHVWGTITKKNAVMYKDNDFEIFIDPDGDNHNYYEFEVNALNTIWELTLAKPYRDGGPAIDPTNIDGLQSAVHVRGTLNNPRDTDEGWSVEVAIPWKGLKRYRGTTACPPQHGDQWRMGFSRVEWIVDIIRGKYRKVEGRPENNWTWSTQGIIAMHCPERWNYVQFSTAKPGRDSFRLDPTLPARDGLMEVYHQQAAYKEKFGRYANSTALLDTPFPAAIQLTPNGYIATATIKLPNGQIKTLQVQQDGKLWCPKKK